ncbi:MAG TPA: aconitate hydratase [Candidatus Avidesulfovibrio excrementigallinarum]|nr:aconitate hydratase [Candidatus Avidesulfovibrio excrementigallinarum]
MSVTLFSRICREHHIDDGEVLPLLPDQVLLHDALGTPVCLQLEAVGVTSIKPLLAIYCDHNTLQVGYRNDDDHVYLYGMAKRLGAYFFRPGEGICHQTHLERFSKPGDILLGADSHTPTCGGAGMLSIGVGGLTVVGALAGEPYRIPRPSVLGIKLVGKLSEWVTAKDVALHLLKTVSVKGGVGKIFEFYGPGVETLSVNERATICNMGAEAGATASIFPSDLRTLEFLRAFGREADWRPLAADDGAVYDEDLLIDLAAIEPLIACPSSPDNVRSVQEIEGLPLDQVCIGSCTNASYADIAIAAAVWKGRRIPDSLDVSVAAGTRMTLAQLMKDGYISPLVDAGARVLEACCGPCNAAGMSPGSGKTTLRTFNRNFKGRSGTLDAQVYLCSPQTAAVSALTGRITDPRTFGAAPALSVPSQFSYTWRQNTPVADPSFPVEKGPNIKPMPIGSPVPDALTLPVKLLAGDNITTDHILPGGAEMLALRSNVPDSVPYVFERIDPEFGKKANTLPKSWCVIGGENYGQGSSREHAVMVPLYIGMKAVIAVSFARIYRRNLINFGILPLTFADPSERGNIALDDELCIEHIHDALHSGTLLVRNVTRNTSFAVECRLTADEYDLLLSGGVLKRLAANIASAS